MEVTILNNEFNGIITDNIEVIDDLKLDKVAILNDNYFKENFLSKVYEWMYYEIRSKKIELKNPKKKIIDSLRIIGLDISFLERRVNTLSQSEKVWIKLAIMLISNPNTLVLVDVFKYFDKKNEKKLIMLLQRIKDNYNKTIIMVTNNTEILYKYTKHLIVIKKNKVLVDDDIKVLEKEDLDIKIPEIVELTNLIRKKNIKIEYHNDVRDILKDIYKHV